MADRTLSNELHAARYEISHRLMGSLLHDVRNPLNTMSINLEILSEKVKKDPVTMEKVEKNLRVAREQIMKIDGLLRQFSEFMAPRPLTATDVDLLEVVHRASAVVAHETRKSRVQISASGTQSAGQLPHKIFSQDPSALSFLVLQALMRAISRCPAGTEVSLNLHREGDTVHLQIDDQGQNDNETQLEHFPLALGVMRDIALQHNAQFNVEGSRFAVGFPATA